MKRVVLVLLVLASACTYKIDHAIEQADFNVTYDPPCSIPDAGAKDAGKG